jgi:RimJ/RimL family protein N-acetyltransferase
MADADSKVPVLLDLPDVLYTSRLTIRCPRPGDGPAVFAAMKESLADLRAFPASMGWALTEPSVEESEQYCREAYSNFIARRDFPLLLVLRDSNVVVGSSGLHRIDWRVPKCEVGFWGRSSHQRKGYITEGVRAIVAMAFDHLRVRRVEAVPDDLNERSCRICERLGFSLEGILRHERADPDGSLRNTRVYAKVQ